MGTIWEHLLFDLGCENYFSLTWDVKIIQPHRSNTCSWFTMGAKKGNQRAVCFDWKAENYATAMVWNYQTAQTQTRVSEEVFASFGDWKLDWKMKY